MAKKTKLQKKLDIAEPFIWDSKALLNAKVCINYLCFYYIKTKFLTSKPKHIHNLVFTSYLVPQLEVKAMRKPFEMTPTRLTKFRIPYHVPATINKKTI